MFGAVRVLGTTLLTVFSTSVQIVRKDMVVKRYSGADVVCFVQ